MKKLNYKILKVMAFTVITLFMSSSVFAQVQESKQDTTAQDTATQMNDAQQTTPQEQNQRTGDDMQSKHADKGVDYSKTIDKEELPQDVNSSLDELYPAHEIQEAFRGEDESFKVKVKNETDEAVVYYDSEGKFLRAENLSGLQQEGALPQEQGQRTMESGDQDQYEVEDRQKSQDAENTQQETQQDSQQGDQQQDWGTQEDDQDAEMQNQDKADPQEQYQQTDESSKSQGPDKGVDYSESVQESDLPQEVTTSLDELYPAHEIQEIHQGNDDSYKVKVKNEDDVAVVYYDSKGDFLRAQNLSGLDQKGALPQEQSQRIQDDMENHMDSVQGNQQEQWNEPSDDMEHRQDQWENETDTMQHQADPQEMNQSIEDVEESQDADRWGTDNRTPDQETDIETQQKDWENKGDTIKDESSAYPQEQNQQTEGSQDEEQLEDNWGTEDMGAHQSTWKDSEGNPQEQNQQVTEDEQLEESDADQSTWMGGEGTDTTSTPSRIDTTAVYNNQWEEGTFEEGDDTASPQEQNQQADNWSDADTTDTQNDWGTTSVDTTHTYDDQMMEDNSLENDDMTSPQEQNQRTDEWGESDNAETQSDYNTTPDDTTDTYNDQMREDNTLDGDDKASPQEQNQVTRGEDVDYNEEIQESELPETVTNSLEELYPDHEIEKVLKGDDGSYKVEVTNNNDKVAVYYDSDGLFYRDEELNNMLKDENKDTNQDW